MGCIDTTLTDRRGGLVVRGLGSFLSFFFFVESSVVIPRRSLIVSSVGVIVFRSLVDECRKSRYTWSRGTADATAALLLFGMFILRCGI